MRMRRWLLLLVIVTIFIVVAAVDGFHLIRSLSMEQLDLLDGEGLLFEARDVVLDFGDRRRGSAPVAIRAWHTLAAGWGPEGADGVWTAGSRSVLRLGVPAAGHRTLFVECKPNRDRGRPPGLGVVVNESRCGSIGLTRGMRVYRVGLPEGLVQTGINTVELTVVGDSREKQAGRPRTVLIRRLVLAENEQADFDQIVERPPVSLNRETGTLVIRRAGVLELPFEAPVTGGLVSFRYRFRKPQGDARCDLALGRKVGVRGGVEVFARRELVADLRRGGRFRVALGDHAGPTVLRLDVNRSAAAGELVLSSPRLLIDR
jgi:hypothetical protein